MVAMTAKTPKVASPERYRERMRMTDQEYKAAFAAMMASASRDKNTNQQKGGGR